MIPIRSFTGIVIQDITSDIQSGRIHMIWQECTTIVPRNNQQKSDQNIDIELTWQAVEFMTNF